MARRGRGEGGVYQRGDGKWVASLDLGNIDGKRVRKVVYGKTRREAATKLEKAKQQLASRTLILESPTVETWLRYWRDEIAVEKIRPSTMRGYNSYIERHIIPRIGHHRLERLEPSHVRRMCSDMMKDCEDCKHKPRHGLERNSAQQAYAILRRALKVAEREGKVSRNVADLIDGPGNVKHPRKPLTVDQARIVLRAAEGDQMESRWYAALMLGMRQGEALGLSWADVNLDEGCLYVSRALQRQTGKGLVYVAPKSDTSVRRIPVPPMVSARLKVHWAHHVTNGGTLDDPVWSDNGKPISPEADYKAWVALLKKAGVPHVALHAARNTTGSLLMHAGVPDKIASEILGHATVAVTQAHYQMGDIEQQQKAMLALEAYVG